MLTAWVKIGYHVNLLLKYCSKFFSLMSYPPISSFPSSPSKHDDFFTKHDIINVKGRIFNPGKSFCYYIWSLPPYWPIIFVTCVYRNLKISFKLGLSNRKGQQIVKINRQPKISSQTDKIFNFLNLKYYEISWTMFRKSLIIFASMLLSKISDDCH